MPTETLTRAIPTMLFKSVLKDQHPGTPGPPGEAKSAKQTIGSITSNPVKKADIFFIIFHLLSDGPNYLIQLLICTFHTFSSIVSYLPINH
jgi:hypothetical protein